MFSMFGIIYYRKLTICGPYITMLAVNMFMGSSFTVPGCEAPFRNKEQYRYVSRSQICSSVPIPLPLYRTFGADISLVCSLPFMLAIVFSSALSGLIISLTGNYWNILVFGPWLVCVGAGLLYTLHETSPNNRYIGYQVGTNHNQQSLPCPG